MALHTQIVIPFASTLDEGCQAAIKTLKLPNLTWLMNRSDRASIYEGDEFNFYPAHERDYYVDDYDVEYSAVVTPCHWNVGIDQIRMENPNELQISASESRSLFDAVSPYFLEDGVSLAYDAPNRWFAKSDLFFEVSLASMDRVIGRNVDTWLPPLPQGRKLRRLQNEMQMLLHTHPANTHRESIGLQTINSLWFSNRLRDTKIDSHQLIDYSLRESALQGDWLSWSAVWKTIDQTIFKDLCNTRKTTKGNVGFKLCGERNANSYDVFFGLIPALFSRSFFRPQPSINKVLASL